MVQKNWKGSFIYIIAHEETGGAVGPIKLGVANDPKGRLRTLQTGNPKPLVLHRVYEVPTKQIALAMEEAFHCVLKDCRLYGEWFNLTPGKAHAAMLLNFSAALRIKTDFTDEEIRALLDEYSGDPPPSVAMASIP